MTDMPIVPMYLCVQMIEFAKVILGLILVSKGVWIRNIIDGVQTEEKEC